MSFLANTLVAKQLQLLQGLLPASSVIGILVNPGNPNAVSDSPQAQAIGIRGAMSAAGGS